MSEDHKTVREFEADVDREMDWPRVRFNFNNGWSASVIIRTSPRMPCEAMQAALAACPTGHWGSGATELGQQEATADEVAAYLAAIAARPSLHVLMDQVPTVATDLAEIKPVGAEIANPFSTEA